MKQIEHLARLITVILFVPLAQHLVHAQETTLGSTVSGMRIQAQTALDLLNAIHDPAELSTWDGRCDLPAEKVYAITDEVRMLIGGLREPLTRLGALAQQRLNGAQWAPVADDLVILGRDVEFALNALVLGAEEHQAHAAHTTGCQHENVKMREGFEAVRDIRDTLALVSGTLDSFGIFPDQ